MSSIEVSSKMLYIYSHICVIHKIKIKKMLEYIPNLEYFLYRSIQ